MGKALKGIAFKQPNAELHKPIGQLLDKKKYVRPREIARAAISLLKVEPQLQKYLTELNFGKSEQSLQQTVSEFCELPLLLKIMSVCPLADLQLETLLKDVRAKILFAMPSLQATPNLLEFQSALALQCFTNEYIYEESEHEKNSFRALEASVEAAIPKGEHPSDHVILCLASYKALHEYKWCDLLPYSQNIQTVIERQINEPISETHLKSSIPLLEEIADDVSLKVKAQYERNPYPRWINMELALNAEPLSKVVSHLNIKLFDTDICKATTPNILIAGCGTGQHSISTAARFKNSRVLAVDLSLSSLAYAKRKTEEFDVTNIEYMQADILKLEKLDRRFDIVESAGVLHHMDQPMKGWKVLVDCLNEGGLMKIGLYSALARQSIAAMQREINEAFISSSDADMKSYRMKVIASDLEQHQQAKLITDFYSLSEFRDLLFHVQEHRFTISQLKKCLAELGLKFCGFENASAVENFRQTNTRPEDLYNLDLWKTFEEDNPQTFRGMYQFWCQKIA